MIMEWNRCVEPGDTVYHLGDFTLCGVLLADQYFKQLHGEVKVLSNPWHHDKGWLNRDYRCTTMGRNGTHYTVKKLGSIEVLENLAGQLLPIVLCHYPFARWDRSHHSSWHLHGHSHGKYHGDGLILDVGVDSAYKYFKKYRPFSIDDVQAIMDIKKHNMEMNHEQSKLHANSSSSDSYCATGIY